MSFMNRQRNSFQDYTKNFINIDTLCDVLTNTQKEEGIEPTFELKDKYKTVEKEEKQGFLSFSYGVWVTAWARFNLLTNLVKLDKYVIYADTDSLKIHGNYDEKIIIYNDIHYNIVTKDEINK